MKFWSTEASRLLSWISTLRWAGRPKTRPSLSGKENIKHRSENGRVPCEQVRNMPLQKSVRGCRLLKIKSIPPHTLCLDHSRTWTGLEEVSFLSNALFKASLHTLNSLPTAPRSQPWRPPPPISSPMSIGSIQPPLSAGSAIIVSKSSRSSDKTAASRRRAKMALPSQNILKTFDLQGIVFGQKNPLLKNWKFIFFPPSLSFTALPLVVLLVGRLQHYVDVLSDVTTSGTVPGNITILLHIC